MPCKLFYCIFYIESLFFTHFFAISFQFLENSSCRRAFQSETGPAVKMLQLHRYGCSGVIFIFSPYIMLWQSTVLETSRFHKIWSQSDANDFRQNCVCLHLLLPRQYCDEFGFTPDVKHVCPYFTHIDMGQMSGYNYSISRLFR